MSLTTATVMIASVGVGLGTLENVLMSTLSFWAPLVVISKIVFVLVAVIWLTSKLRVLEAQLARHSERLENIGKIAEEALVLHAARKVVDSAAEPRVVRSRS